MLFLPEFIEIENIIIRTEKIIYIERILQRIHLHILNEATTFVTYQTMEECDADYQKLKSILIGDDCND